MIGRVVWPPRVGATIHCDPGHWPWEGEVRAVIDERVAAVRLAKGFINGVGAEGGYSLPTPEFILVYGREGVLRYGPLPMRQD